MPSPLQPEQLQLTPRQSEIMTLVSKGCSNSDIARLLTISPNTVKAHLATILERLNVSNRTEASVVFEKLQNKHPLHANDTLTEIPSIGVCLVFKNLSRSREIAENLAQLLQAFELLTVRTQAEIEPNESAQQSHECYRLKLTDFGAGSTEMQLSLVYQHPDSTLKKQLFKANQALSQYQQQHLIKRALQVYQHVIKHQVGLGQAKAANGRSDLIALCESLMLCDALSFANSERAMTLCDGLIQRHSNWHLPHAIKAVVLYRLITSGHNPDSVEYTAKLTQGAKIAFSLKPSSAWSQLAFAYHCVLNSDLSLATKHLHACLAINPCQYRALQLLGQLQAFMGATQNSINTFTQLLEKFPNSERDGLCYGALALVYYCAADYPRSQQAATRALMYEDAAKVPMIITLLSVAELQQDQAAMEALKQQLLTHQIDRHGIENSLAVAAKIVPPDLLDGYRASLTRAGVI